MFGLSKQGYRNKIFIYGKANKVILIFSLYSKLWTTNRPIIVHEITLLYIKRNYKWPLRFLNVLATKTII